MWYIYRTEPGRLRGETSCDLLSARNKTWRLSVLVLDYDSVPSDQIRSPVVVAMSPGEATTGAGSSDRTCNFAGVLSPPARREIPHVTRHTGLSLSGNNRQGD